MNGSSSPRAMRAKPTRRLWLPATLVGGLLVVLLVSGAPSTDGGWQQRLGSLQQTQFSHASSAPACSGEMQRWPLNLRSSERKVYSQTMQDGVLEEIFLQLGTTNKYFVEFGFDANNYTMGVGANTQLLWEKGWRGLLMDGSHDNPDINLHQEFICPENIVSLFQKYNVPLEPDYVSIDIDSSDIWILLELTKVYKPRVITVEYNQNFPAGSTFAWPPGCTEHWLTDRVMGSSLGAIFLAAQDAGYKVVHVIDETDAFLVRNDIAACLEVLPQWVHEARCTSKPLHAIHADTARPNILIDYATFRATGDLEKARWKSRELVQFAPLLRYPNGFEVRPDGK